MNRKHLVCVTCLQHSTFTVHESVLACLCVMHCAVMMFPVSCILEKMLHLPAGKDVLLLNVTGASLCIPCWTGGSPSVQL